MKITISTLPIVILLLIALAGYVTIHQAIDEKELNRKFENKEIIEVPQISFENLYEGKPELVNLDFIRKKYSLLNVFASWCSTCYAEHETLLKLKKSNKFNIYGIAYRDIDENTKKYLQENKNPYIKVGVDRKGELEKILSVNGIPETFLIDQQGRIIYRHQGNITQAFLNYLLSSKI